MFYVHTKSVVIGAVLVVLSTTSFAEDWSRGACLVEGRPTEECYDMVTPCHFKKAVCGSSTNQFSRKQINCIFAGRAHVLCAEKIIEE
jgi:hypothetical protein